MKEGLLERIRAIGHWRVVMRPRTPLAERLTLQRCFEEVERARVSIRGWDYPHVSYRNDEQGGTERGGDFVENWCDWNTQIEFWRMHRSGQFLSYSALYDDTDALAEQREPGRQLNAVDVIYSVTEFLEFGHRLAQNGLYADGFQISVGLIGTQGRRLVAGRGRMPFMDDKSTAAAKVEVERIIEMAGLEAGAIEPALGVLVEFFDHFGWNPAEGQLRAEQDAFYRRQFG